MLHLRDLVYVYPNGTRALDGISLELPAGMFGLLGPNGAGKSTLMRCIATLQVPQSGRIQMDGLDVLIIDALQYRHHPSHLSLEQALGWIEQLKPRRAILTHMHIPLDYETVMAETPEHVEPAYDQMVFEAEIAESQL